MSNFIPDSDFIPDQASANVPTKGVGPGFIPDAHFKSDEDALQEKYGTLPQQAMAAVEAVGRGALFGLSDKLLTSTGDASAEDIRGRMEANPMISAIGNISGAVGTLGVAPIGKAVEGAVAGTKAISSLGKAAPYVASAIGYGTEGAALGAGNAISDQSLGDGDVNAQKILADIGIGAAFGSGLGLLSKGIEARPSLFRKAASKAIEEEAIPAAIEGAETVAKPIFDSPASGIKPTSIEDVVQRVREAGYRGERVELPAKSILEDAASRVEMFNPIHPLQLESLENQSARDLYKTAMEIPGEEGNALRSYEALQKQELTKQTKGLVKSVAPESAVISDATKAGERASEIFSEQYQTEKKAAGELIGEIKSLDYGIGDHLPGVIDHMVEAVPSVSRIFDTTANEVKVLPYSTKWGIEKATYNAVKDAVEALKSGDTDFETLLNIRKGLDQNIDLLKGGSAAAEIGSLKRSMMDYAQGIIDDSGLPIEAREAFKRYAINEEQRKVIEKAFGASVGSPEFGTLSKVKPEEVSDKIFKNTATTSAAKDILPSEKFKELLANWMSEQIEKVTDKGAFSSNKFGTFLKNNQDVLNEAFADNPSALTKLKDINNIMRILPDSASINPSGTAKTLLGIFKAHSLGELLGNAKGYAVEQIQKIHTAEKINLALAGKADQATKLEAIQNIVEKKTEQINTLSKSIFSNKIKSATLSGLTTLSTSAYNKEVDRIRHLANDPTAMMDHLSGNTDALYAAAPNITQSLHSSILAGVNFLNSKIPGPSGHFALAQEYVPSNAEKDKFLKYYQAVDDPISSLKMIKQGSLTSETMEALNAVQPHLLSEMQKAVLQNFKPEKAKDLDYSVKISLAKFLGSPLDSNMTPQSVMGFQSSLSMPNLGNSSTPKGGMKPTLGGLKQLDLAGRSKTQTQQDDSGT